VLLVGLTIAHGAIRTGIKRSSPVAGVGSIKALDDG